MALQHHFASISSEDRRVEQTTSSEDRRYIVRSFTVIFVFEDRALFNESAFSRALSSSVSFESVVFGATNPRAFVGHYNEGF